MIDLLEEDRLEEEEYNEYKEDEGNERKEGCMLLTDDCVECVEVVDFIEVEAAAGIR